MKTNRMRKTAAILLALVLISSCFASGTFAKYVAEGGSEATARGAKWGVSITATGDAFANSYATDDKTVTTIANSVLSSEDVIAPGTSGKMAAITISGSPEVASRISFRADLKLSGWEVWQAGKTTYKWVLDTEKGWYDGWWREDGSTSTTYPPPSQEIVPPSREGTYEGETIGKRVFGQRAGTYSIYWWYQHIWTAEKTEDGTAFYCPIVITVGDKTFSGLDYDSAAAFEAAVEAAVAGYSTDCAANTDLSTIAVPKMTWSWAFDSGNDAADTALGNAKTPATIALDISATVTQLD